MVEPREMGWKTGEIVAVEFEGDVTSLGGGYSTMGMHIEIEVLNISQCVSTIASKPPLVINS